VTEFLWADALRDLGRTCGYAPRDVLEGMTFGQFYAVWVRPPQVEPGVDWDKVNARIRKRRRELGLDKDQPAAGPKG
jgi:hypothetical protein